MHLLTEHTFVSFLYASDSKDAKMDSFCGICLWIRRYARYISTTSPLVTGPSRSFARSACSASVKAWRHNCSLSESRRYFLQRFIKITNIYNCTLRTLLQLKQWGEGSEGTECTYIITAWCFYNVLNRRFMQFWVGSLQVISSKKSAICYPGHSDFKDTSSPCTAHTIQWQKSPTVLNIRTYCLSFGPVCQVALKKKYYMRCAYQIMRPASKQYIINYIYIYVTSSKQFPSEATYHSMSCNVPEVILSQWFK